VPSRKHHLTHDWTLPPLSPTYSTNDVIPAQSWLPEVKVPIDDDEKEPIDLTTTSQTPTFSSYPTPGRWRTQTYTSTQPSIPPG